MTTPTVLVLLALLSACTRGGDAGVTTSPPTSLALPTVTTEASTTTEADSPADRHPLARRSPPAFDQVEWRLATSDEPAPGPIEPSPPAEIGDRLVFFYGDAFVVHEVSAELVYANQAVTMWFEEGVRYDADAVAEAADRFATELLPTIEALVGPVPRPGIDGDHRVAVLHLTQLGGSLGEFASYDLLPQALFPDSNQREMLYVAADVEVGSDLHLGTIAHELVHLIDFGWRPNRPLWMAEGIAQMVEHAVGLDSVTAHLTYLASQTVQVNDWGPLQLDDRHYGGSYLLMVYLRERFGDDAILDLMASEFEGMAAIEDVVSARGTTLTEFFGDWIAAVALDRRQDSFAGLRLPQQCGIQHLFSLPATVEGEAPQFAPRFFGVTGSGQVDFRFIGDPHIGPIPDQAHSGDWMWWAGPSDESAATLTRKLDLTGLDTATLSFAAWFDTGYTDSGSVMVSDDDGASWTVLGGEESQSISIGEVNDLKGYTGWSGAGAAPEWITDTIDLSAVAGSEVLVRFQFTTDLFEGRIGFAVDDISLVELETIDNAEEADSDWVADGFQRVPDSAAQRWVVQVLDDGGARPVDLVDGRGTFSVDLADGGSATVAVAAVVPGIGTHASYELRASGPALLAPDPTVEGIDTFDVPCTGWDLETTSTYDLEQIDGRLDVTAIGADSFTWSANDQIHDIVDLSADMTFSDGFGAGGLMCRLSPVGFYELNVANDGTYLIGVAAGEDYEVLVDWTSSDLIRSAPGEPNRIGLACTDTEIVATLNGDEVARIADDRLPSGRVSVIAASYESGAFTASYDNVAISSNPAATGGLVAFDAFDSVSAMWPQLNDRGSRAGVEDGEFVLTVLTGDWSAETYSDVAFDNVTFSADFRITSIAPDGLVGAACHTTKTFDQYLFLLAFDDSFAVQGVIGVDFVEIVPWTSGSGLRIEPDVVNHMEVTCADGQLRWTLNGLVLAEVEQSDLESGRIGFIAYSYDYGQLEMRLDNVRILDPDAR